MLSTTFIVKVALENEGYICYSKIEKSVQFVIFFCKQLKEIQENPDAHRTQNFLGSLSQHQILLSTKLMSKWIEEKNKK